MASKRKRKAKLDLPPTAPMPVIDTSDAPFRLPPDDEPKQT